MRCVLPLLLALAACGRAESNDTAKAQAGDGPAPAAMTARGPVGLYFMTRFWAGTGSLERTSWYFLPDGRVYRDLITGFTEKDLAAHAMELGRGKREYGVYEVTGSDGKVRKGKLEMDEDGTSFTWDMGIFTRATPFGTRPVAGTYAFAGKRGGGVMVLHRFKTLELLEDGTFRCTSDDIAQVAGQKEATSEVSALTEGTWKAEGFTMTLTSSKDGSVSRRVAFPVDDKETERYPDWLFHGGMLYKRQ